MDNKKDGRNYSSLIFLVVMKFMKCPNCNKEIQESSNFCSHCGVKLEVLIACGNSSCPDYGKKILPSDSKFCPTCGHALAKEHKESSTDIALNIDLDFVHILRNKLQKRLVEILK